MNRVTLVLLTAALVCSAGLASAQEPAGAWRGQDNEFGSIRTPYTVEVNGARADLESKVVLRKNYDDKDSRFFMFAWTVRGTHLNVDFTHLVRADTGAEMPCYKTEGTRDDQIKCFVDLKEMPPVGTEMTMFGSVGADRIGSWQIGAIVVPFTYTWERVPQTNGLDAELYGDTVVNVQGATDGGGGPIGGLGNAIPGLSSVGVVGALALAAILVAARRKKSA